MAGYKYKGNQPVNTDKEAFSDMQAALAKEKHESSYARKRWKDAEKRLANLETYITRVEADREITICERDVALTRLAKRTRQLVLERRLLRSAESRERSARATIAGLRVENQMNVDRLKIMHMAAS